MPPGTPAPRAAATATAALAAAAVLLAPAPAAGAPPAEPDPAPAPAGTESAPVGAVDARGHRPARAPESPHAVAAAGPVSTQPRPGQGGAPPEWERLGPPGGDVADVAASPTDPGLVLAGVAPGGAGGGTLYRATDGGQRWREVPELADTSVLSIDFAADGRAYLGTQSGVWTSPDGRDEWRRHDLGIGESQFVHGVTADPSDPETVWAGVADSQGQQPVNLVRSTDGGVTWVDRTPPLPAPMSGRAVAVGPERSGVVVAGFGGAFGGGAVWASTDGGESWQDRSGGLPANPIRTVHFDGSRLLVGGGQLFSSQFVGVYASDDLGGAWTPLHDAGWPNLVVADVAVAPDDPATLLVATAGTGVHRTVDGGESWELGVGGTGALTGQALAFPPGRADEVLLGTGSLAVWRSTDGGDRFRSSGTGIAELNVTSVAANPADPAELAASFEGQNHGGVLTTVDAGRSWELAALPATRYQRVGYAADGTLHALSNGPTSVAQEGLYRRLPDGRWRLLGPDQGPLFESDLYALAFGRADPDLIMLGGRDFGVAGDEATIWRSTDDGATWTKTYEAGSGDLVSDLLIVPGGTDRRQVAAWTSRSGDQLGGALRSAAGGADWEAADTGLPGGFFREPRLCASPAAPEGVFLSVWRSFGSGAVYRSDDAGAAWTPTGWTGPRIEDIACDPVEPAVVYVSQGAPAEAAPVARSTDRAVSFTPFTAGLPAVAPGDLAFTGDHRLLLASRQGSYRTPLRASPPGPDPVGCDRTVTGLHSGPLAVADGVTCLAAGSRVLGEVTVAGGAGLMATAAVVQGPLSAAGAAVVRLSFTQVTGPVHVAGVDGPGSLLGNQVTGSVTLVGNAGPRVAGNTVVGSLACVDNDPAPTDDGLPNTVTAGALGQCADL